MPIKDICHARELKIVSLIILLMVILMLTLSSITWSSQVNFYTWKGIGPDKWSSIWFIKRNVNPEAIINFIGTSDDIPDGIAFDMDLSGVAFRRTGDKTTYEKLVENYDIKDSIVRQIGDMVNEIEINRWSLNPGGNASRIETAFRTLQRRYGRSQVPFACYLAFFDLVYKTLKKEADAVLDSAELVPDRSCETGSERAGGDDGLVAELPAEIILDRINAGEKIIFVDARESDEFAEFHIPNAVNLQLREVDAAAAEKLADADLVVPYCVKDFRGYEVARAFQKVGLHKVAIMNPYGIKGWRQASLPVAGKLALTEDEAARQLASCARDSATCLKKL